MLAAMWKKEKWLNVERSMGAQSVSARGNMATVRLSLPVSLGVV